MTPQAGSSGAAGECNVRRRLLQQADDLHAVPVLSAAGTGDRHSWHAAGAHVQVVELVDDTEMHAGRVPELFVDGVQRRMQHELVQVLRPLLRMPQKTQMFMLLKAGFLSHRAERRQL